MGKPRRFCTGCPALMSTMSKGFSPSVPLYYCSHPGWTERSFKQHTSDGGKWLGFICERPDDCPDPRAEPGYTQMELFNTEG